MNAIQLIGKQSKSYNIKINGFDCVFIPMSLYFGNSLFPLKPQVHKTKGYLFWNVNGNQISYNQIKECILKG